LAWRLVNRLAPNNHSTGFPEHDKCRPKFIPVEV
jgi:hypothetical protein